MKALLVPERPILLATTDWRALSVLAMYVVFPPALVLICDYIGDGTISSASRWVACLAALPFLGALISNIRSRRKLTLCRSGLSVVEPNNFEFVGGVTRRKIPWSLIKNISGVEVSNDDRSPAFVLHILLATNDVSSEPPLIKLGGSEWLWTPAGRNFVSKLQSVSHAVPDTF